jgi:hypothetical protein
MRYDPVAGAVQVIVAFTGTRYVGQGRLPHALAHDPLAQSVPAGHTVPQVPQFALSVPVFAQ